MFKWPLVVKKTASGSDVSQLIFALKERSTKRGILHLCKHFRAALHSISSFLAKRVRLKLYATELIKKPRVRAHPYVLTRSWHKGGLAGEVIYLFVKPKERRGQLTAELETSAANVFKSGLLNSLSCRIGWHRDRLGVL